MNFIPPLPSWEAAHVLVVHIPVALLLVSPLFILLGIIPGRWQPGTRLAALVLLLIGTAGAILAVESGEAAEHIAVITSGEVQKTLERHSDMGEWTRNAFIGITTAYAAFVITSFFLPFLKKTLISLVLQIIILLAALAGALLVANTGHLGGQLVHQYNIRAPITQ